MNKAELIEAIAKESKLEKKQAEAALNAMILTATKQLVKGEKFQVAGIGTFEVAKRAARMGRNPKTGEAMKIKASKALKFRAAKALKDAVNKKK